MPETFGKYQMLTRIASGGMAEVWLARSSSIGGFEKLLAIKKMHANLSRNQSFVSMFIDEAKLTVSLSHPNIVQIFDFGRVDDDYFMAMEFVDGSDLASLAKRGRKYDRRLPVDVSASIMRGVFDGLSYAHSRVDRAGRPAGIIHRDVSPQNVLVSFDGHVKVSDFGIARAASKIEQREGEELFGKAAYLAPEQCEGEAVTAKTDMWAAGVILHELLTNSRLFLRDNDRETLDAVIGAPIPRPSDYSSEIPRELDHLTLKILERDPEKRPTSARQVADELGAILSRRFPVVSEARLREAISEMWDHKLPRVQVPGDEHLEVTRRAETPPSREKTLIMGDRTVAELARSRRATGGVNPSSVWSRPAALPPPTSEPNARLGEAAVDEFKNADLEPEPPGRVVLAPPVPDASAEIRRLKARFIGDPNLWVLVDMARVWEGAGQYARAQGAYALAAAKFAQRGLLVQAATIHGLLLQRTALGERQREALGRLRAFEGRSDDDVLAELSRLEGPMLDLSDFADVFTRSGEPVSFTSDSPILSLLDGEQLGRLIPSIELWTVPVGGTIVSEGDAGDSFFLIGRGRVLVSTKNFLGQRIYVTSLSDGDCFGEHGFFTGGPRTATVEALEEALILEISKDVLNRLVQDFPSVRESLRRFYKERIAESLLAKSPLFGQLSTTTRKMLAERFTFETYGPGDLIIREGDRSDAFYALKAGAVRVYKGRDENAVTLAELGTGEIFGEVAALEGSERTASVRATTECEILRLEASVLQSMLTHNEEVRNLIREKIAIRAEERSKKTGDSV